MEFPPEFERILERKAGKGEEKAMQHLSERPEPSQPMLYSAFWACSNSRPQGMSGVSSIPMSEIVSYCDIIGVSDPDQRVRIMDAVQAMDNEFREHFSKKGAN